MMWFEKLTGFAEESPQQVRDQIEINGTMLTSKINGKSFDFGKLEIPSLEELKNTAPKIKNIECRISISEVVGNVQDFHLYRENRGALFQAASQFNLLEMVGPHVTPENGVGRYQFDRTQGPACAIACGAGTIYRNYFAKVNGQIGQTKNNQIDCLEDIGEQLGNKERKLWQMKNGYALISEKGLKYISTEINAKNQAGYDDLKAKLRVGIQWDVEVTISENRQKVSQVYCSALPVAYSTIDANHWEYFARLVLEGAYEATFYAALHNYSKTGNNRLYLTLLGGGAFGNKINWITDAIRKTVLQFSSTPLDVKLISYGESIRAVRELIDSLKA